MSLLRAVHEKAPGFFIPGLQPSVATDFDEGQLQSFPSQSHWGGGRGTLMTSIAISSRLSERSSFCLINEVKALFFGAT